MMLYNATGASTKVIRSGTVVFRFNFQKKNVKKEAWTGFLIKNILSSRTGYVGRRSEIKTKL